jgi:hypothetical protein
LSRTVAGLRGATNIERNTGAFRTEIKGTPYGALSAELREFKQSVMQALNDTRSRDDLVAQTSGR